ncbi:hypothetical protein CPB85DRAFT_1336793 [Mucidula mucida]|nr:hypothetical protein CPB85DRAFT_1336793 [Mucidula mucida]
MYCIRSSIRTFSASQIACLPQHAESLPILPPRTAKRYSHPPFAQYCYHKARHVSSTSSRLLRL